MKQLLTIIRQVKNWQYSENLSTVYFIAEEKTLYEPLLKYRFMESTIHKITQIKIHFTLHPNLHLNISADYIYFSSNSFLKCHFGSLTIFSFGNFLSNNPYLQNIDIVVLFNPSYCIHHLIKLCWRSALTQFKCYLIPSYHIMSLIPTKS